MEKLTAVVILAPILFLLTLHSIAGIESVSRNGVVRDVTFYCHIKTWIKIRSRMADKTASTSFSFIRVHPQEAFVIAENEASPDKHPIVIVFVSKVWNVTLSKTNNTLYFMHPDVIQRYVIYSLKHGEGVAMIYAKEHFGEPSETFKTIVESLLKATFGDMKKTK